MPHLRECHARRVDQHDVAAACMRDDGAGPVEHTVRVALADHGCAHHWHVIMAEALGVGRYWWCACIVRTKDDPTRKDG
jgi:hypothetical protein